MLYDSSYFWVWESRIKTAGTILPKYCRRSLVFGEYKIKLIWWFSSIQSFISVFAKVHSGLTIVGHHHPHSMVIFPGQLPSPVNLSMGVLGISILFLHTWFKSLIIDSWNVGKWHPKFITLLTNELRVLCVPCFIIRASWFLYFNYLDLMVNFFTQGLYGFRAIQE